MSAHDSIKATAAENARLLQTISETDYAPSALQQSNSYIANLRKEILEQEKLLRETKAKVAREYKDHREYADSHVKRLAYRMGGRKGKFEEKASKEEREWVDAVQKEIEHKRQLDTLNRSLAEATSTSAELERTAATYAQAQRDLDHLYNSIFEGPTPGIPGEDMLESAARQAADFFSQVQGQLNKENQVRGILTEVAKFIHNALIDIEDARSTAKADTFGFGGAFMEIHEHNAVSRVQQHMNQAQMLLANARNIQPLVGDLGNIVHAQNDFVMDILFDNIFTDMDKYEKIKQSKVSIEKAQGRLKEITNASEERLQLCRVEARSAKEAVDAKRAELQDFRANAYREIAGGMGAPSGWDNGSGAPQTKSAFPGPPPEYQP